MRELVDYAEIANKYCKSVLGGSIPASKLVRAACKRQIDDLKRERKKDYPYRFDPVQAGRVCKFLELLPHTKGRWATKAETLTLEPWQCFILTTVFGWVRKDSGFRRFRSAYIEVPRKNGKSFLSAGVGLFMLLADKEFGAEVYSGASSLDQARKVFEPAWNMVNQTPMLQDYYGVDLGGTKKNPGPIYSLKTSSKFEAIIGNPGDGASPTCAIVDEYHEHRTDALYETMQTGMGSREQPLLWTITTAGADISGPCYALHQDVRRVLNGSVPNDQLFGIIYGIDKEDEWHSDSAIRKANPNYGVSVDPVYLRESATEALNSSRKQAAFKTKHCNVWVQARAGWMNMELWNRQRSDLTLDDFESQPCWVGVDLSSKIDVASVIKLFPREEEDGKTHWYVFGRHYLPETRVEDPDRRHYQGWVTDGYMIATPGDIIDHKLIENDLVADSQRFRIVKVGYDPYGATQFAVGLENSGIQTLEIPQTVKFLSDPMKWVEALVISGQLHHDDNPVMNWMMSNVTAREDANENVFPRKERVENKIDGPAALIIAEAVAMREPKRESVYMSRGLHII